MLRGFILWRLVAPVALLFALWGVPALGLASSEEVLGPGFTQALREAKLSMTVNGRVEGVLVREGDRVKRGDLLLHLDRTTEELEVRRRQLLLQDTARLEELRLREVTLTQQLASARDLLANGTLSRKQVEDEELALRAIIAERLALEFAKQREEVELQLSREAFERRHLRAPLNGVVAKIHFRVGESIAPHEPVLVLVDVSRVRFLSAVSPAAAMRLKPGQMVLVSLGADARAINRRARVVFVSPTADPASGLVEVTAEFDNPDGSVKPGVTGRLALEGTSGAEGSPSAPPVAKPAGAPTTSRPAATPPPSRS
jgi:RND family efflux transporter MFP subunit